MSGGRSKGPDERFCRSCGEAIKKDAAICPSCGVATDGATGGRDASTPTASTPEAARNSTTEADPARDPATGAAAADNPTIGPEATGMFHDALRYPGRGPGAFERLFISSVLAVFAWLLVPLVVLAGYCGRVLRTTADGEDRAPPFDDATGLLVNGLIVFGVTVAFLSIPAGLLVVGAWVGSVVDSSLVVGGSGVGTLALLVGVTYVYPAVVTNALSAEGVGALSPGRIGRVVASGSYLGAWIVGFVIAVGGGTVSVVSGVFFLFIPFFGVFLGTIAFVLIASYTSLSAFRAFGIAYRRAQSRS